MTVYADTAGHRGALQGGVAASARTLAVPVIGSFDPASAAVVLSKAPVTILAGTTATYYIPATTKGIQIYALSGSAQITLNVYGVTLVGGVQVTSLLAVALPAAKPGIILTVPVGMVAFKVDYVNSTASSLGVYTTIYRLA